MKKKTVAITAPTGMLGSMVYKIFKEKYNLVLLYRDERKLDLLYKTYGKEEKNKAIRLDLIDIYQLTLESKFTKDYLSEIIGPIDAIINCAGIIKPYATENPGLTSFINSAIPHILSDIYKEKLLQITTDCIFNGEEGAPYDETASSSANDLYGISKSLGEPSHQSLVLRTSIIGPEIHGFVSLISWLQRQKGIVTGYTNHFWNGVTTKEFARICDEVISNRAMYPQRGIFHIFSSDVTKYQMLKILSEKYSLPTEVIPKEVTKIDRRLRTKYSFNTRLDIPNFQRMIELL